MSARWSWPVMGSTASLSIATPGPHARLERVAAQVRDLLAVIEARFSPFLPDGELVRLREGRLTPEEPSAAMREVIEAVAALQASTAGAFHPFDHLGRFDPTGYVKGWAIEQAMGRILESGITDASLGIGGDIQTIGRAEAAAAQPRPWRVAVVDPADPARIVAIVAAPGVDAFAVATSGSAQRGEHIWAAPPARTVAPVLAQNPGRPGAAPGRRAGDPASVTVLGPELRLADAYATAIWAGALTSGLDDAWSWLGGTGYEALAVDTRGAMRTTAGMGELLVGPQRARGPGTPVAAPVG
jgi:thiamine biosynthesis lipoprotein